jgi:hypothetical protein
MLSGKIKALVHRPVAPHSAVALPKMPPRWSRLRGYDMLPLRRYQTQIPHRGPPQRGSAAGATRRELLVMPGAMWLY